MGRGLPRPSPHRLDAHRQLPRGERLGDIVVGADRQTQDAVELLVACGQHDDVGIAEFAQPPAHLDAVHDRQTDVEQHQVGGAGAGQLNRGAAVAGDRHRIALVLQQPGSDDHELLGVLHQQGPVRHWVSAATDVAA